MTTDMPDVEENAAVDAERDGTSPVDEQSVQVLVNESRDSGNPVIAGEQTSLNIGQDQISMMDFRRCCL